MIDGDEPPQAIFCVNDPLAFGVMDYARFSAGLAIPGDLKVIGFDDIPEAQWLNYQLTTFRQDPALIATKVIKLLERRRSEPGHAPARERFTAPLVVRDSFKPRMRLKNGK